MLVELLSVNDSQKDIESFGYIGGCVCVCVYERERDGKNLCAVLVFVFISLEVNSR